MALKAKRKYAKRKVSAKSNPKTLSGPNKGKWYGIRFEKEMENRFDEKMSIIDHNLDNKSSTPNWYYPSKYSLKAEEIALVVDQKQEIYGDSFGKSGDVMSILYPDGIALDQMHDALTVVRIVDKLFRIATDKDALGESPYEDLSGYGLLGAVKHSSQRALKASNKPYKALKLKKLV